jgi:hypothetical protein
MVLTKKSQKRGRPSRAAASAKALADVDLSAIDPRTVLLTIAADTSAPATARVAACRALLGEPPIPPKPSGDDDDPVTRLALQLLKGTKK